MNIREARQRYSRWRMGANFIEHRVRNICANDKGVTA